MKPKIMACLGLLSLFAGAPSWAQGQVNFGNRVTIAGIDVPFFDCDGVTRLSGPEWVAQLYAGPVGTPENQLRAVGIPVPFRTGAAAGYLTSSPVVIPGIPLGGPAVVQVRMWEAAAGPSYESAVAACRKRYQSNVLKLAYTGWPPAAPVDLVGLQAFHLLCGCDCPDFCVPLRCSITREGEEVVVSWSGQGGMTYALQHANSLAGEWRTVLTQTAAGEWPTASQLSASYPIKDAGGYFRVLRIE
ncbi:MAG: hypothetical protein HS113_01690 [Verrucomicrobiales bacterium]|nr:hypothetical protein [Verrucomicrobiales bacterium]